MMPIGKVILPKHVDSRWIDMPRDRRIATALLIALTVFLALSAATADEARIIQLKHRPASEVIPLLRPLLGPDDALSGMDYRLIIRTSDRNLKEIERILSRLDVEQRRLRITVEQLVVGDRDGSSQSLKGEAIIGDKTRIYLPEGPSTDRGLVVQKNGLQYTANRRATKSTLVNTQTVMTLDGQRAYIRIGQSVPHVKKILAFSRHQALVAQGMDLRNVTTGFEVVPRVHGNRVRIEIIPRLSTLENSANTLVYFQELATTVEAKLGEWIDLGSMFHDGNEIQREILESASMESGERRTVRLKIE